MKRFWINIVIFSTLFISMAQSKNLCLEKIVLSDGSILEGYIAEQSPSSGVIFQANRSMIIIPSELVTDVHDIRVPYVDLSLDWKTWINETRMRQDLRREFVLSDIFFHKIGSQKNNKNTITVSGEETALNSSPYNAISALYVNDLSTEYLSLSNDDENYKKLLEQLREKDNKGKTQEPQKNKEKAPVSTTPTSFSILQQLDSPIKQVHIVEQGLYYRFVDLNPRKIKLNWNDIKVNHRIAQDTLLISGITEVIRLKNKDKSEYHGEIVAQIPGSQIRILTEDGIVQVINSNDISIIRKEKKNPNQTIIEQTPLLEIVELKDGTSYEGIIIEQNFVTMSDDARTSMTIELTDGSTRMVQHANMKTIRRKENPYYKPVKAVVISGSDALINGTPVFYTKSLQITDDIIYLTELVDTITIDFKNQAEIVLQIPEIDKEVPYKAVKLTDKTIKKERSGGLKILGSIEEVYSGFSYADLIENGMDPVSEDRSISGVRTLKYIVKEPGYYLLYQTKQKKGFLVYVKNNLT